MLGVVAVFVFTVFDPLEFESVTKHHSAKIFYKIYAASYPTTMRDSISVVFLDDLTLEKEFKGETWPPSHKVHGAILAAILSYQPAAVLIDMFFFHTSADDYFNNTTAVIDDYEKAGVPLFVDAAGTGTGAHRIGRPEIDGLAFKDKLRLVSAELAGEPGQPPLYPLHRDSNNYEPAALALYRAVCSGKKSQNERATPSNDSLRQIRDRAKCHDITDNESTEDMDLVWGLEPASINCQRANITSESLGLACEDFYFNMPGRAIQLLWEAQVPALHRPTDPMPIAYHAEIATADLLRGENHQKLARWLNGKLIIYSSQVAPRKDFVLSPVHGSIDGAFIHAMALDNLLTFGDEYIHHGPWGRFQKDWTEFQPAVLMLFATGLIALRRHRLVRANSPFRTVEALRLADEVFLRRVRWVLIGLIALLGFTEFFWWSIAPFNWLGLLIVVHIAHWIDRWFFGAVEREADEAGWS
jgi:hypothetical protein